MNGHTLICPSVDTTLENNYKLLEQIILYQCFKWFAMYDFIEDTILKLINILSSVYKK